MERNAVPRMLLAFVVIALGAAVARPTERSLAQDEPFTLIDFEDAPSGRSGSPAPQLGDFYGPDVVFTGTETALVFDADTFPALPELARSGSTVVTDCYGRDVCSNEIRAGFSVPQLDVEVWVGSIDAVGVAGLQSLGSNNDIMDTKIFDQEQISRAADLGLGASCPSDIDLISADDASREYRDRVMAILNEG